jgi:transcription-repair coupling factor (superfamily II helicase)
VSCEGGQIILRYPPLPEGESARALPQIVGDVRTGKNAFWLPFSETEDWQGKLSHILDQLLSTGKEM